MMHKRFLSLLLIAALLLACLCGCRPGFHPTAPTDASTEGSVSLDQGSGGATDDTPLPSDEPTDATVPSDESTETTEPETEPPTQPSEPEEKPTEPAAPAFSLVGTWTGVRRDGAELNTSYFVFEADGTGYSSGCCYMNIHNDVEVNPDVEADEAGWYVAPMGYPGDRFTYKLENGVLSITYTGSDIDQYDPFTQTHTLQILGDDLISLDDRYGKYTREDLSLKDLCTLMGVNYAPPSASTASLVGGWYTIYRDSDDCLNVRGWNFSQSGIASPYYTWYDHSSKKIPGVIYGEPNADGWCEAWDEPNDEIYDYSLEGDVLTLVFSWGEHMQPEDVGLTTVYALEWVDDNTIRLTKDGTTTTFVRSDDISPKELCARLGVDYSAP